MLKMEDKIKGALYGVAVGDALGAPLEFMSAEEIARRHGTVREMIGGGWLNVVPGEITDDTQMTLAVAEGIRRSPDAPVPEVGLEFIKWILTRPKDVGGTCSMSIKNARALAADNGRATPTTDDWFKAAGLTDKSMGGKSAGNGSLMRTVYPGVFYKTFKERTGYAGFISLMTHLAKEATNACMIYSAMVGLFTEGSISLTNCIELFAHNTKWDPDRHYDPVLLGDWFLPIPSGYVVDSFQCALHCLLTTSTFEDAVVKAVNLGGDADTIGAITGGLAGAMYGFEAIPERWVNTLDGKVREPLDSLAQAAITNRLRQCAAGA